MKKTFIVGMAILLSVTCFAKDKPIDVRGKNVKVDKASFKILRGQYSYNSSEQVEKHIENLQVLFNAGLDVNEMNSTQAYPIAATLFFGLELSDLYRYINSIEKKPNKTSSIKIRYKLDYYYKALKLVFQNGLLTRNLGHNDNILSALAIASYYSDLELINDIVYSISEDLNRYLRGVRIGTFVNFKLFPLLLKGLSQHGFSLADRDESFINAIDIDSCSGSSDSLAIRKVEMLIEHGLNTEVVYINDFIVKRHSELIKYLEDKNIEVVSINTGLMNKPMYWKEECTKP